MKNVLIVLCFYTICSGYPAKAQKAYDIISYKTTINGGNAILHLADGYLLASKVSIQSKFGDQAFSPSADEPDKKGDFRFDAVMGTGRYKNNKGSWIILKNVNLTQYLPQIKAMYWDGKTLKKVLFKQFNNYRCTLFLFISSYVPNFKGN